MTPLFRRSLPFAAAVVVFAGGAALPAQQADRSTAPAAAPQPHRVPVHVIGASVSGGFEDGPLFGAAEQGDSVALHLLLRKWAGGAAKITAHNTLEMAALFQDPLGIGRRQLDAAKKAKPELVVALDFPFWFAYGYVGKDEPEERSALLGKGLGLLAELEVPVVIGDLPDMTGAARRMLSPAQIPSPAVLRTLNAELRAFVAAHANFRLVELATVVDAMRTRGVELPLADGAVKVPKLSLQQGDHLHATRLGMAYLGHAMQPVLAAAFPAGHALQAQRWTFEQFVAAAGAEDELDELRETVAAGAAGVKRD